MSHAASLLRPPADAATSRPTLGQLWTRRLPLMREPFTRFLCRFVNTLSLPLVAEVENLAAIAPDRDPFILALNHNQRPEAVLVPTRLIFLREGRLIHFFADWNFLLVPFVATLYRRSGVVVVARKNARPRFLTRLRPLFDPGEDAFVRAARLLGEGRSVGIFPEGRINRDPTRLLRGQRGAARLALQTGVPIVPGGIVFPSHDGPRPIGDLSRLRVRLGEPITAERRPEPCSEAVDELHSRMMRDISVLCGKSWSAAARRR